MNSRNSIPSTLPRPLPWCKFPTGLLTACEDKKIPSDLHIKAMVGSIADYMLEELKDTRTGMIRLVARSICDKYPVSFADRLGDVIISNGVETLVTSICNRINYVRKLRDVAEARASGKHNAGPSTKASKRNSEVTHDAYGTVAYNPGLPPSETKESQESKQAFLREEFVKMTGRDEKKIEESMAATYPSQRCAINHRGSKSIGEVLGEWPFLREPTHFLRHTSQLLGKQSVFSEFTQNIASNLHCHQWMVSYIHEQKTKNKKTRDETIANKVQNLTSILEDSANASKSLDASFPLAIGFFAMLPEYFEEENRIFKLVDKATSDEAILELVDVPTPLVVIKGDTLYSKDVSCVVVIENVICFRTPKVVTAILIAFSSYFVFGLKYPQSCRKTLEYIQRALLSINEPGSKDVQGVKRKRKGQVVHSAVKKLCTSLNQFWVPPSSEDKRGLEI